MSNFETRTYDPPQADEPPILKFDNPDDILDYPRQDRFRLRRVRYPSDKDELDAGNTVVGDVSQENKRLSRVSKTALETPPHNELIQRRRMAYECDAELLTKADNETQWHVKAL